MSFIKSVADTHFIKKSITPDCIMQSARTGSEFILNTLAGGDTDS